MLHRILLLAGAALLGGCPRTVSSEAVAVADIAQAYEAHFDAETDRTTVWAAFLLERYPPGGDPFLFPGSSIRDFVELVPPSYLEHDSIALEKIKTEDQWLKTGTVRYKGEADGYVGRHVWRWMDKDGGLHENEITIERVEFVDPPLVLSKSAPPVFAFAPGRGPDEQVSLQLEIDPEIIWGIGYAEPGSSEIVVAPELIAGIANGTHRLRLVRRVGLFLQEPTESGGRLRGTARSDSIEILLEH